MKRLNTEVFQADKRLVMIGGAELGELRKAVENAPRKRCRICCHPGADDALQEMFIALARDTYVRPHRHRGKSESFYMVEGELDVVLFDDDGAIVDVIQMGAEAGDKIRYYRLSQPVFHMPLVRSKIAIVHEVTNGPFAPDGADDASWAPAEGSDDARQYRQQVESKTTEDGPA